MALAFDLNDTIAAIASASGAAYRGIIRISGEEVLNCLAPHFLPRNKNDLAAIKFPTRVEGAVAIPAFAHSIPCDLFYWPTNRSYTRQPSVELHVAGSNIILNEILSALCNAGARFAEPGEFTMRAFLAGRIDLTQAEAVMGVIDAASKIELDVALEQLSGGLAGPLSALRTQLLELLAHLEAGLDFVEEDIEFISSEALTNQLESIVSLLQAIESQVASRKTASGPVCVTLTGRPNAGKSSLFNALLGQSAAITSASAGTTRDYISSIVEFDGITIRLVDTAGLGETGLAAEQKQIDELAQDQAVRQSAVSQLVILCLQAVQGFGEVESAIGRSKYDLVAITKADLVQIPYDRATVNGNPVIETSSKTGRGIDQLKAAIVQKVCSLDQLSGHVVGATAARCADSIAGASNAVQSALATARRALGDELVAADLRVALDELGRVAGAIYTDDILDVVFSRFCIGK